MTPHTVGLQARALRWRHSDRWIVDGVDLGVRQGEIVGLLGPNGAGKTVTLSLLVGLLTPTSGRILLDGVDITHLPQYRRARGGVGYLPQERSVFRGLSARDNVLTIFRSRGLSDHDAGVRTDGILEEFGLASAAQTRADRLSGGQQRRLEVARSLATDPRFLLFDEPFTGIDPLTIESIHSILVSLRARDVGVILTDHNVFETLSLCDRACILVDGRVLTDGTPASLVGDSEVRRHFLGAHFSAPQV